MRKHILLFIFIVFTANMVSQNILLENPNPPSPTAKQMDKFTFYPVSHATGIPDISIPLYEFTSYNFNLPITLQYHSSGIKFGKESPFPIGYGWKLSTSYSINRYLRGREDDKYLISPSEIEKAKELEHGPISDRTLLEELDKYIASYGHGEGKDTEYDIFTINLPTGVSGSFIMLRDEKTSRLSCQSLNNERLKIDIKLSDKFGVWSFDIIDEQGIRYLFGTESIPTFPNGNGADDEFLEVNGCVTSWMLNKITLTNEERIFFYYKNKNVKIPFGYSYAPLKGAGLLIYDEGAGYRKHPWENLGHVEIGDQTSGYTLSTNNNQRFIANIDFPNGSIRFQYSDQRMYPMLEKINIFSSADRVTPIKTVSLSREKDNNTLHFLSEILIDKDPPYKFKYTSGDSHSYNGLDFWGYSNGSNNITRIPYKSFYSSGAPNGSLTLGNANISSTGATMTGMLKQIIYPTGGTLTLDYEMNAYNTGSDRNKYIEYGCGLRIKMMTLYDNVSRKSTVKEYKYGSMGVEANGVGHLSVYPSPVYYYSSTHQYDFTLERIHFDPLAPPAEFCTYQIENYSIGKNNLDEFLSTSLPIWYDCVTEYTEDGRIVYNYTYGTDDISWSSATERPIITGIGRYANPAPLLKLKTTYNKENEVVKKEEFTFGTIGAKKYYDLHIEPSSDRNSFMNLGKRGAYFNQISVAEFFDCSIYAGETVLGKQIISEYEQGQEIKTITDFKYNSLGQLTNKTTQGSCGNTIVTKYTYPSEGSILHKRNMLSTLLKTEIIDNNKNRETIEKNYSSTTILPSNIQQIYSDTIKKELIRYDRYNDKHRLLESVDHTGLKTNYLWAYDNQYLIAEIKNSDYTTIEKNLGRDFIDYLSTAANLSPTDIVKVEGLRYKIPSALISTYTYKPLIGMLTSNDPSGKLTSYEYDENTNHLKAIKNSDKQTIVNYARHIPLYKALSAYIKMTKEGEYFYNKEITAVVETEGGSGDFTYTWSIDGIVKQSSTNAQFTYIPTKIGEANLSCELIDNIAKSSLTLSRKINTIYEDLRLYLSQDYYNSFHPYHNITQEKVKFITSATGGSGNYSYFWTITKDNNIILQSSNYSPLSSLDTKIIDEGEVKITCKLRDQTTGLGAEQTRSLYFEPFISKLIIKHRDEHISLPLSKVNYSIEANASYGSGSYAYTWEIINEKKSVLMRSSQKTFPFSFPAEGWYEIRCTVTDVIKKQKKEIVNKVYVYDQIVDFVDVTSRKDDVYSEGGATLRLTKPTTITFYLTYNKPSSGSGRLSVSIGRDNHYSFDNETSEDFTVTLPPGEHRVSLSMYCDSSIQPMTNASINLAGGYSGSFSIDYY